MNSPPVPEVSVENRGKSYRYVLTNDHGARCAISAWTYRSEESARKAGQDLAGNWYL